MRLLTRASALTHFSEIARLAGLNPEALVRDVGLPVMCLSEPELMVPADAVRDVLELAAARSAWSNFGLRMAEGRRLSNLGPLGLLLRDEPTLRRALEVVVRYLHTYNQALALKIEDEPPLVLVRAEFMSSAQGAMQQGTELTLGVMCRFFGLFMGTQWRPRRVCFTHAAPKDRSLHVQMFGPNVEFGHDFNGIVIDAPVLDVPNPSADPVMARYARQVMAASEQLERPSPSTEIRNIALMLLPTGSCKVDVIAQHLGVDRRTVHRHLAREGRTFSGLVNELRRGLAQRYVEHGHQSMEQIAVMLGFAYPSSFSRWYRSEFKQSARMQRREQM